MQPQNKEREGDNLHAQSLTSGSLKRADGMDASAHRAGHHQKEPNPDPDPTPVCMSRVKYHGRKMSKVDRERSSTATGIAKTRIAKSVSKSQPPGLTTVAFPTIPKTATASMALKTARHLKRYAAGMARARRMCSAGPPPSPLHQIVTIPASISPPAPSPTFQFRSLLLGTAGPQASVAILN